MNHPARRKSSLSGANPANPAESAPQPAAVADAAETRPPATPRTSDNTSSQPKQRKYPPKVSFYQDPNDTSRVRGAILHTMTTEGARTLSQFIDRAVMTEVERLEAKYNAGKPFPPIAARELPQGRPMGE